MIYRNILIVTFLLFSNKTLAEYRAYVLTVTDTEKSTSFSVTTTLDDIQYRDYYTVKPTETISISETWMCFGRTDLTQICANPKRLPAAQKTSLEPAP